MDNRILVIDALNCLFQLKHRKSSSVLWDFITDMKQIACDLKISRVVMCCDAGQSTYRLKLHPGYKGDRIKNKEKESDKDKADRAKFLEEANQVIKLAPLFGFDVVKVKGVEADDLVAYLACHTDLTSNRLAILSSDSDLFQLLRPNIVQRSYSDKMTLKPLDYKIPPKVWLNTARFKEAYEIDPWQYAHYKALAGDTGDSIKSPYKVGETSAMRMIQKWGTLEGVKANLGNLGSIPRFSSVGKDNLRAEFAMVEANLPLVNLNHTPEVFQEMFGDAGIKTMQGVIERLQEPPTLDDDALKELMFQDGKVRFYDGFEAWTMPLRGFIH